jgi:hypothetical protein
MRTKGTKDGCGGAAGSNGKTTDSADRNNDVASGSERELPRLCYSVDEVCKITGLCRTTVYANFKSGALVKTKIGRRTVVLHEDLVAFLRNSPKAKASGCVRSTSEQRGGGDE